MAKVLKLNVQNRFRLLAYVFAVAKLCVIEVSILNRACR